MYSISIFLFYILLIWGGGCVRTQRPPPAYVPAYRQSEDGRTDAEQLCRPYFAWYYAYSVSN